MHQMLHWHNFPVTKKKKKHLNQSLDLPEELHIYSVLVHFVLLYHAAYLL